MCRQIATQLTQIKVRRVITNHTDSGFYGDGFAPSPEGSLLGLGVRAAHPFFCLTRRSSWRNVPEKTLSSINKVPLLGDIPFLGFAFRNSSHQVRKTEIVIFLTPKIVTGDSDVDEESDYPLTSAPVSDFPDTDIE